MANSRLRCFGVTCWLVATPAWCFTPAPCRSELLLKTCSLSNARIVSSFSLFMATDDDNDDKPPKNDRGNDIARRFTSPTIDDPALPLSDVLVAQIIGPSVQIAWLSLLHAPLPTWLRPIFDTALLYSPRGSLVAPALIHGAALASCWVVGALAAKAYERSSISPVKKVHKLLDDTVESKWDYSQVWAAVLRGGAFATGLLILSTQADLFFEYGRWVQLGESDEIDFRLLVAAVELINDVFFEALTIATWRLFLAYQTERIAKE